MYTDILDGLANFNQINNLELYLQDLQPYVKCLRQNYWGPKTRYKVDNPQMGCHPMDRCLYKEIQGCPDL